MLKTISFRYLEKVNLLIKYWFYDNDKPTEERQRTIEHLERGYPDIWNIKLGNDAQKNKLLEIDTTIKKYIVDKLKPEMLPNFEWDYNSNDLCDFSLDRAVTLIYNTVEDFSNKGGIPDDYKFHSQYFACVGINIVIDKNKKELVERMKNFEKLVETTIKDKILYEQFGLLHKEKADLVKNTDKFKQHIENIKHKVEKRHENLEGTCKDCEHLHKELKSLE